MLMREVMIAPQSEGKGRTFRATLLATVEADLLWSGGLANTDTQRPVWAMFGGSDQELRSFMANVSRGRLVLFLSKDNPYRRKQDRLEFLKASGIQVVWQREEEGSLATIFLPELFQMDPGMVSSSGAKFILLPTQQWYADQNLDPKPLVQHALRCGYSAIPEEQLASMAPISFLFAAYLDRRTRCPLVADGRFYFQLMLSCLKAKLASFSTQADHISHELNFGHHQEQHYHELWTSTVGLYPGLAFRSDHATLEKLLSHEVELFFKITQGAR